ncbi:benzoylformate decarboxylase [Sphingomonas bacterium]|uniref:benzoylformate decarboxylase n=1 Tax=Sphingomonas bacterium TaxID=1895847 RepID=UPI0020C5CBD3|nr:benzoylformate decarboxylase [Sphingomonas bacterium]
MRSDGTMVTVREATLALLRAHRMTTIFGNPGSTELPMFRDFPDDFSYVLGLQESVVLAMADGYAQATRNAAFVNLHSSAGVGHALGSLFTAHKNQTPLVVTAGQQARSILPYDPFLFAERATEFPRPFVKWACEPARAEDVPAAIARAYHVAMEAPCGPTFVSVPVDDWDRMCASIAPRAIASRNPGDPAALREAAETLAAARRPAIVVGAGVARDDAWHEVVALAERHAAQVWVSPMSARCGFPEDHPLFAGFLTAAREPIVASLDGHDVILVLGGPMSLYHVEGFGPHVPEGARIVQIADNHGMLAWNPASTGIVADTKLAVATLLDATAPPVRPTPAMPARKPDLDGRVFDDRYLLQQIARLRPADAIIVEEAPSSRGPMHDYLPITRENGFYTCASGGLGHGLPAAIGVALGRPGEKVIAFLGDGSSMYAIQGLWTAAQLRLPVSFVIANNHRYEALHHFGRHFGLQDMVGTNLPAIDFCALAQGQGIPATKVAAAGDLDAALTASFTATGPTLIEVVID